MYIYILGELLIIAKDVTYLEDVCYPKKNIVLELLWPEVYTQAENALCMCENHH